MYVSSFFRRPPFLSSSLSHLLFLQKQHQKNEKNTPPCSIAVALLQEKVGLQSAMLLVPVCYAGSGVAFFFAEKVLAAEKAEAREAAARQERRELKKVRKEGAAAAAIVAGRGGGDSNSSAGR